jgi:hypothetical protein
VLLQYQIGKKTIPSTGATPLGIMLGSIIGATLSSEAYKHIVPKGVQTYKQPSHKAASRNKPEASNKSTIKISNKPNKAKPLIKNYYPAPMNAWLLNPYSVGGNKKKVTQPKPTPSK